MDFQDFIKTFETLDLCHQLPDIVPLASPPRVWRGLQFHGRWMKGVNAGGRPVCTGQLYHGDLVSGTSKKIYKNEHLFFLQFCSLKCVLSICIYKIALQNTDF